VTGARGDRGAAAEQVMYEVVGEGYDVHGLHTFTLIREGAEGVFVQTNMSGDLPWAATTAARQHEAERVCEPVESIRALRVGAPGRGPNPRLTVLLEVRTPAAGDESTIVVRTNGRPVPDRFLHMASTGGNESDGFGWICRCDAGARGFATRDQARGDADTHLNWGNER
jgi:hypothetical protein